MGPTNDAHCGPGRERMVRVAFARVVRDASCGPLGGGNRWLRVEGYAPTGSFFRVATHLPGTMREEATVTTVTKQERAHGLTRDS